MDDGIYVPLSDETLQKLDELVSLTGLTEDGLIGMLLYKFLRELRTYENDNFPETSPSVSQPNSGTEGRSALGASNSESRPEL
jgi:hypothetical protein